MKLKKSSKKKLLSALIALIIIGLGGLSEHSNWFSGYATQLSPGMYHVTRVHDGDTISVIMDGREETIRFIGIDTPETHDPRKPVQCFGRAASAYATQLIGNGPVRLEADPLSTNRDRYDRLLRYVYLPDGRLAQAEIIKNGYGFAYTSFPFIKSDEFLAYQRQAREQNRGLWDECEPEKNQYGGFTSNPEN